MNKLFKRKIPLKNIFLKNKENVNFKFNRFKYCTNVTEDKKIEDMVRNEQPHTVLIDSSAIIYKSYHSISADLHKDGVKTNAVFGFIRSLLNIMEDLKPIDYIAIVGDTSRNTNWRRKFHQKYKENRDEVPSDLIPQFPIIVEGTNACGIKYISQDTFESDDIIATLSKNAEEKGHKVTIVSPDKDFCQLITPNISLYDPNKDVYLKRDDVKTKFDVFPEQFIEFQSLSGDKSDNIPGVKGIGPKKAAILLNKFGNIENIYNKIDEVAKTEKKALLGYKDDLEISRKLVTLVDNVPIPSTLEDLKFTQLNKTTLYNFLKEYNFYAIINKHFGSYVAPPSKKQEQNITQEISKMKGVTIVDSPETAKIVLEKLMKLNNVYHACDTETIDIDVKNESPVGHGKIICASIYCGPEFDFGNGPRIWINNLDKAEGTINYFKEYFEDESIKKVWHNYSFDKHILENHGIHCKGFGGDTMHMARLWNSSRNTTGGYSLAQLSKELLGENQNKKTMTELFGRVNMKIDGTEGKETTVPPLEDLQRDSETIEGWINYSTLDTEATWYLREKLHQMLKDMHWQKNSNGEFNMWDFYHSYFVPFGELLTEMETEGIKVDVEYLKQIEQVALKDLEKNQNVFKLWASKYCPDALYMNTNSAAQKQQLFFAPAVNSKTKEQMPIEALFKVPNVEGYIEEGKKKPKKNRDIKLRGFGFPVLETSDSGFPSVGGDILKKLAGSDLNSKSPRWGIAYNFFGGGAEGEEACKAIASLVETAAIDTLLSNFILPLQRIVDKNNRVHGSLNLNTETGRLSSRNPNLQNQPALEKDIYKIRKAFTCEPGNLLIGVDYGQLELRLLAHITDCKSMIEAFKSGGDFHSRTAIGMYPYVSEAVKNGDVLLEWDNSKGVAPKPLLKDIYGTERRRAKTLNFSIAYGKTARGLSQDWGVTLQEAQDTLERWYSDRPEVKSWQKMTIDRTRKTGYTLTLMGRRRPLPDINGNIPSKRGHAERASINTPLQGGAADVVMSAMLKIRNNQQIKELGWRQILQIHDEIILEGPKEHADQVLKLVGEIMSNPFKSKLKIDLVVDGRTGNNWYECK
eukprot:TRINITY_DN4009_c0_g1_i1.p1 TRINITY_DN4009_c0_g1~~TRINITY_DN4009_c0_g1_i1.p1  ORF type:complete len:1086 (-),score=342.32 TRINITY_DN4009_c0_g1_i1:57-3314(-)